jgi:hypothetical protein
VLAVRTARAAPLALRASYSHLNSAIIAAERTNMVQMTPGLRAKHLISWAGMLAQALHRQTTSPTAP